MTRVLRELHRALAILWAAMIPVAIFTPIRNSVPFLVAVSVYALAVGHFSSFQAVRAEHAANGNTSEGT